MAIVLYDLVCSHCGREFSVKKSDKLPTPSFCSNDCKFASRKKPLTMFTCVCCGENFERRVYPNSGQREFSFCSRSCQMKTRRDSSESGIRELTCVQCGVKFTKYVKQNVLRRSGLPRFCSKKCSSKFKVENGLCGFSSFESLIAAGKEDVAKKISSSRSSSTTRRNTGRKLSEETREKISQSCTGIQNPLKGKTFVEFYGEERARELRDQHSQKLREGFTSGRLSPPYAEGDKRAVHGKVNVYKGTKLRSLLERHAIEFLEERDGLTLGVDLIYEDPEIRVQWIDEVGKTHTYIPDLHDTKNGVIYEVKPNWQIENMTDEISAKWEALKSKFSNCGFITDKTMKKDRQT